MYFILNPFYYLILHPNTKVARQVELLSKVSTNFEKLVSQTTNLYLECTQLKCNCKTNFEMISSIINNI